MLKGLRITLSLIALSIAIYSFFTGNREIMLYMFIFLGGMAFIISIEEILKQQKGGSILALLAGAVALFLGFSEIFR
ncbi:DUF3953 domain-containing protein [Bacillus sp. TH22]|uniref:DUF3953 domain-containing protein n=1 Tax=unclassified Bacillus (in: firmicutes) TaxID=185979 RepID=UPI001911D830|nr:MULTISPECIES: DUF3953 domain-containing protein [unclassified Bacillus (in: firmicutes)]MBK5358121.1 DUF3953 domain-containing protein [Bacillus sp. TH44]MBK5348836.1 DUF3953 domain-containing protein [Bacillus sp. TH45]MBK5364263.1 DUF3953 domain-containing protein [Bacillus sp. TH50]MBK5450610.1 DUF3953 domain-containing protein [Bacillus sp. TH22]MBK5455646.1 DUF3953 domain-containing protein [Bacillus sp. TH23]